MKQLFIYTLLLVVPFITHAQFENYPDMELGFTGTPVVELQKFLNTNNYIINPVIGEAGSVGYEGTYFGTLTQKALSLFQKDNTILPSAGYFGTKTKEKINSLTKEVKEGDLSALAVGGNPGTVNTYTFNYLRKGIPGNPSGCNNTSYNPPVTYTDYINTNNTIGPFSYPVKMTFVGTVDDNLMINDVIVDKTADLRGGNCSHKHSLTYSQTFLANTPIRFKLIDQYGVEASLVGTVTIEKSSKKLTISPTGPGQIKTTITSLGKTTTELITGLKTIDVLEGDKIELEAQANSDGDVVGWTDATCQKTATPNVKYLKCKSYPITITSAYKDTTVSATFKKKVNKCSVIAYGGYNAKGQFTGEIEKIVNQFIKNNKRAKITLIKEPNGFSEAAVAGQKAHTTMTNLLKDKDQKILGLFHSISSIGAFNWGIKSNSKMKVVLYDPPYNMWWQKYTPWFIPGNPEQIKKAKDTGIAGSSDILDLTNGTAGKEHSNFSYLPNIINTWLEENCI